MDFPLIHKFEAGYRAGVKAVCPECQLIVQYAGVTFRYASYMTLVRKQLQNLHRLRGVNRGN